MNKKSGLSTLLFLVLILFVVGIALLILAHNNQHRHLFHDLSRDIGIAFIVSALVTVAYETYARTRFDLAKISSMLETVYGSGVSPGVWESIKDTLLRREVIRRNVIVHLRVLRNPDSSGHDLILEIDLAYDLQNLQPKEKEVTVTHGLDEHITATGLPRFLDASIGDKTEVIVGDHWEAADHSMKAHGGRLDIKVVLRPSNANVSVPLRIRRREVRECPGSYYLIMTEVTEGLRIYLDECAEDVRVDLIIRPREGDVLLKVGDVKIVDDPLLPGHGLEFKFTNQPPPNQPVELVPPVDS